MPFRRRLLVFGYPALELLTIAGLIAWIGLGWVLLILVAGVPLGMLLMRAAGRQAIAVARQASRTGTLPDGAAGLHAIAFVGGALVLVPGIWSKVIGLLLQIPPVQVLVAQRFAGRFQMFSVGGGEVIPGTVIHRSSTDDGGPAEAGPPRAIEPLD